MKNKMLKFFNDQGYAIIKIFTKANIEELKKKVCLSINKKKILKKKFTNANLFSYHKIISDEKQHKKIVEAKKRYIVLNKIICNKIKSNIFINDLTKNTWGNKKFEIKLFYLKKSKNNQAVYRLARPSKVGIGDVGGYHIDLHYNNKINKKMDSLFTIWTPLIGFDNKYSLKISPRSHKKKHPLNSFEKQDTYISKVFKKNYTKKFKFIRPKLKNGESLIFHPNILHGGSANLGTKTRVSIDFRIYNADYL